MIGISRKEKLFRQPELNDIGSSASTVFEYFRSVSALLDDTPMNKLIGDDDDDDDDGKVKNIMSVEC